MANNVLPLFWNLSSTTKKDRLDASEQLISSLEKFQSEFLATHSTVNGNEEAGDDQSSDDDDESGVEVGDDDDDEDMEVGSSKEVNGEENEEEIARIRRMDRQFDSNNSEDVKYSIKRLIRGLGSSRDSSRLGFAVALTELLSRLSTLPAPPSAPHILSLILRSSSPATGLKGSEERDLLFARLFGLNALISSQLLNSTQEDGARTWNNCCSSLIALGDRKSWLRESAWFSLIRAVKTLLEGEGPDWRDEAVEGIVQMVYETVNEETGKQGLPWTQEKLALTILLQQLCPNLNWQALLSPTFKNGNIFASQNLQALGRVLKEAEIETDESAPSGAATAGGGTGGTGSWKPQPHFVWDIIFDAYFPQTPSSGATGKVSFQEFFRVVVDESLFSPTSSPSRKFWGFEIFSKTLPLLPKTELPLVFTQNFMRVWMSQLSGQDRLLHKAALRVAEQIQSVTKSNPLVGFTLLSQLVGRHGSQNFDRLTKTKTVEGIMSNLSGDAVGEYVAYLKGLFNEQQEGEEFDMTKLEARRAWVFDQLLSLLRNSNMTKQDDWVWSILEFSLVHGLFVVSKANKKSNVSTLHKTVKPPLSDSLAAVCRIKFFSSVIEATVHTRVIKGNDDRTRKVQGSDSNGTLWLERCLQTIEILEADSKHASPAIEVDDEIREARKLAKATLTSIQKKSNADPDVARGVQVLLSFALLKSYDDDVKAYETLEDVQKCAERIFSLKTGQVPVAGDEDLPPVDLLVDVLIGYLDRASSDLRALATAVFGLISSKATSSTIEHLIAQLEAAAGDADEDEDDDENDEDDDDEQMDEDESSDSDEEEDNDEDAAPVDPDFRRKVAEALQVAGMADAGGDDEDVDEDEVDVESESDAVSVTMDDDQMLQLDEKLGEIFRQQKQEKGTATSSAQDSIHFKARVLDLVEAFMKRQPQNALLLPFIPILLRLNQEIGTKDKQLGSKAGAVLQSRVVGNKEVPVIEAKDIEVAGAVLEAIHEIARGAASKEFLALCSHCSVFVSKALAHANMPSSSSKAGASVEIVAQTYAASLKEVMTKKNSRLHTSFISDLVQRQPVQAWSLRDDIVKYANGEGVNDHQQADAFNLMAAIAKQLSVISQSHDATQVKEWIMAARKVLYDVLEKESSDSGTWQAPRIKDVIKTALQIARFSKPVLSDEFAAAWGGDAAAALGGKLSQTKRLQNNASVRTLYGQFELFVSPSAQAAQQKRKEDKKKRKRTDGEAAVEVVAMDVDEKVAEVTQKKVGKGGKGGKSSKEGLVVEGEKKTKKRKVVA